MTQIASYFASLGFDIDQRSVRRVDTTLKNLEKRLQAFGKNFNKKIGLSVDISSFRIDQRKLKTALGNSLDQASKGVAFEVSRFVVNDRNLLAALLRAARRLPPLPPGPNPPPVPPPRPPRPGPNPPPPGPGGRRSAGYGGGYRAGGLSRLYGPALALGLGGYGLSNLNERNQQVVSAQLQTSAVTQQAGGTSQQGAQSFEWLRQQANRVGFNYLDASADYNKLTSGLTGAGMSIKQSQNVFKGFSELSRVNKLDRVQQQRVYRALSQIAGKNKLQSEELTGQLAESLPGAVSIFARAYQNQLAAQGKGGGKEGQEAITELLAAMKKGQVKGDILTYAGDIASQQAAPGLAAASTASQAEQARAQNSLNDLAVIASNSGVESGFARLFRALNEGLKESGPMVESLAKGFDNVSKYVSYALLSVQSLQRFFAGKDSYLGDKFFPNQEDRELAFGFLNSYKSLMTEIVGLGANVLEGWQKLGAAMGSGPLAKIKEQIDTIANGINTVNKLASGDISGAADSAAGFGKRYINNITAPGRAGANLLSQGLTAIVGSDAETYGALAQTYGSSKSNSDFTTPYLGTPFGSTNSLFDYQNQAKADQDLAFANRRKDNFNGPVGIFPMEKAGMPSIPSSPVGVMAPKADVKLDISVKIDAANPEDFKNKFEASLSDVVRQTLDKYSEK